MPDRILNGLRPGRTHRQQHNTHRSFAYRKNKQQSQGEGIAGVTNMVTEVIVPRDFARRFTMLDKHTTHPLSN